MFQRVVAPGIEIRLIREEDADAIYQVVERNRTHLNPWLPWVRHTQEPEDVRAFIRSVAGRCAIGEELHAVIWVEGEVGGAVGHHSVDWANRSTSLGYWIDAAYQGRGIITRCCHLLLDHLFDERGLHRVEIRCAIGNVRSCAVPQRLGFRREGVLRHGELGATGWLDLVVWGILEHEWRKG